MFNLAYDFGKIERHDGLERRQIMGGIGSGRRWHFSANALTSDMRALDVRRWAREGYLRPGHAFGWQWTQDGEKVASIQVRAEIGRVRLIYRTRAYGGDREERDYRVWLDTTPCHLGGERRWFLCPAHGCGRRVALLYGGTIFACRTCHRLAYPSQREDASERASRRAEKIRARLGWTPGFLNGDELKPKGMHWRTYRRLERLHDHFAEESTAAMFARCRDAGTWRELRAIFGYDVPKGG